jgi:hypothetical protein
MTRLRRWRKLAKGLIVVCVAWDVAFTLGALVLVILVAVRGRGALSSERVISIVGSLGLYGIVIWAIRDARARRRRQPLKPVAAADDEV